VVIDVVEGEQSEGVEVTLNEAEPPEEKLGIWWFSLNKDIELLNHVQYVLRDMKVIEVRLFGIKGYRC